jgi:hypothetical protein
MRASPLANTEQITPKKKAPTACVGAFFSLLGLVPGAGLEPARCFAPADFESAASTNFATPAAFSVKPKIMAQSMHVIDDLACFHVLKTPVSNP